MPLAFIKKFRPWVGILHQHKSVHFLQVSRSHGVKLVTLEKGVPSPESTIYNGNTKGHVTNSKLWRVIKHIKLSDIILWSLPAKMYQWRLLSLLISHWVHPTIVCPLLGSNFSISMQFSEQIYPIIVWRPPQGNPGSAPDAYLLYLVLNDGHLGRGYWTQNEAMN